MLRLLSRLRSDHLRLRFSSEQDTSRGRERGRGKGARGCADEKAARWLFPVAPSRYSLLFPLPRQFFPSSPPLDSLLRRHAASLVRWLVECLKRPLCSLWLLCKLNKSSFECKRTDSSGTNTATTHSHTHTLTLTHTAAVHAKKGRALRASEHWMNVNVIVLQMKIDFWIVGTVRYSLSSPSLPLPLPFFLSLYNQTKWNQRTFWLRKGKKLKRFAFRSFHFNTNLSTLKCESESATQSVVHEYFSLIRAAGSNFMCVWVS